MVRPSFSVSAIVVTTLVVAAFVATALRPMLPPISSNRLAGDPEPFLRQASSQPIDWHVPSSASFAEARRLGRPIMLLVGTSWSEQAIRADQDVFMDPEVARILAREFVCIRVDGVIRPEYLNAFLPLTRLREPFLPGFQIWFLDPSGRALTKWVRTSSITRFDVRTCIRLLRDARSAYVSALRNEPNALSLANEQANQLQMIRQGGRQFMPAFDAYRSTVESAIDSKYGGIPLQGIQSPPLMALKFLLLSGEKQAFQDAIDPMLMSPLVDLQDGGFFRLSLTRDWSQIEYSKVAVQNAEWLQLLTYASLVMPEKPIYRHLAQHTFDYLVNKLADRGHIFACQMSDSGRNLRSPHYSVPPQRMLEVWNDQERDFARKHLRMDPAKNHQMIPTLSSPTLLESPETLDKVIESLKKGAYGKGPQKIGERQADVQGYVTARLLESARLMNDPERTEAALKCSDRLEAYRSGDSIIPSLTNRSRELEYLGDYLAAADGYLADYLLSGRVPSLEVGLALIRRTQFLFYDDVPGAFMATPSSSPGLGPVDIRAPEIADSIRESTSAQAVRLFAAYGRILGPRGEGLRFTRMAHSSCFLFSEVVGTTYPAAGFIVATMAIQDDATFFTVGPNAVDDAQFLATKRPGRLTVPVFGPVRPDLADNPPGIYIEERGAVSGPLSRAAALNRVPNSFRLYENSGDDL